MINSTIILKTFNGEKKAPNNCNPQENYWKLIGKKGKVVEWKTSQSRALVQFDAPLRNYGLHCHNEFPNSLLIQLSDVEIVESNPT